MTSNREKKRIVQAGVRKAMANGWNTRGFEGSGGSIRMEQALAESALAGTDSVYSETNDCPACETARRDTGDPTALCEAHLLKALGM